MSSVAIHPPKTPVTEGSFGTAKATTPNVCKMPGPPAPFVPSPLPNIGKSGSSPKGYSRTVKIEGDAVAIRGATFESIGDMASKATGGGLISANTHGPTKFITPGSLTVKIEGKSVHLLGEPMLNNCGASGSPPNTGATLMGLKQSDIDKWDERLQKYVNECDKEMNKKWDDEHPNGPKHDDCWSTKTGQTYHDGKPMHVQSALGVEKENCVYGKMGLSPDGGTRTDPSSGNSVSVQQRFKADGTHVGGRNAFGGTGSIVPDVIYRSADGAIAAVRDLKFPCPSEANKQGEWRTGQKESYTQALGIEPGLIFPI